jgi:hypothetical protein
VKWRQSTAETKLRDRRSITPNVRSPTENHTQCGETNNLIVNQNLIVTTSPILVNTEAVAQADIDLKFDCLQTRDSIRKNIVIRNEATGYYEASNGKSDSC